MRDSFSTVNFTFSIMKYLFFATLGLLHANKPPDLGYTFVSSN